MDPRSLADDLRMRDDAALGRLLRARPDLLHPVPNDVGALAQRATTRASTVRALDRLDLFTLQVLEVIAVLPEPTDAAAVHELLGADPQERVLALHDQGLLWGPPDALRLPRTVRDVLGPAPAGLGPPTDEAMLAYGPARLAQLLRDLGLPPAPDPVAAAASLGRHLGDPSVVDKLLSTARPQAREVLDRLLWGPPNGHLSDADRDVTIATARTPVEWLLARGLLVASDSGTVLLPREVAIHLRGGRVHRSAEPAPPPFTTAARDPKLVDRTAAGAAFTAVRLVEDLLETWGLESPGALRAGGLGQRELRRAASALSIDETEAAFLIEAAYAAGLLGVSTSLDGAWLPTPAYDVWRDKPTEARWAALAEAWLHASRVPGLVGTRTDRDRLVTTLGPELERASAPDVRAMVLDDLRQAGDDNAPSGDSLTARVRWRRPRRAGPFVDDLVAWTIREAAQLGITGLGALSRHGRELIQGRATAAAALAPLLPTPLDYVLLQADLTAVAPGPLTRELASELGLAADVESTGGATVYRFTEASVRRSLDSGRTAAALHRLLGAHSRTPVPQPLTYLIDDVARRHGRIRIGVATAYVRCDDEAVLEQLLAERRTDPLRLRKLAPTVLATQAEADEVLEVLRSIGYAPVAETPFGDLFVRRPDSRRTPHRQRPPQLTTEPPVPAPAVIAASVRAMRAGDRAASAVRRSESSEVASHEIPRTATADALDLLRRAAAAQAAVAIGYVNSEGRASHRVIEPLSVEGGYVSAFDHLRDEVRTFAVHRITGVVTVDDSTP
jgi:hypothetical protein